MTPEEVSLRIGLIRSQLSDDEAAHSEEDALRNDVLVAIADGSPDARVLAAIALESNTFDFERWCA